ncbi:hypothetical protein MNBD_ALPHA09-566 [hydrothermal vent metagenome]|uniref:Methyltransferase type 11 domain-containing protein n=1 Tax=hydrothermal vent metagenome TaxID=652676 RepID=A0A3B0TGW1_9ZZZZ
MQSLQLFKPSKYDPAPRWCPLCGSFDQTENTQFSQEPWRIVGCAECGFTFLANPVSYDDLVKEQAWEKNSAKETDRRRAEQPVLSRINMGTRWRSKLFRSNKSQRLLNIFKTGHVLDIGCGTGTNLPEPLIPFGVEISRYLSGVADEAMRKRGGRCIQGAATVCVNSFETGFFDGVLLGSYLEHETNPLPVLKELHRILKDDGVIYIRVPNYSSLNRQVMGRKWCGFRYPDHVNYFTVKTLARMARAAGFRQRLLNWASIAFDDNIKVTLKKT